ncbi:hypothetical protein D3C72_1200360 [compost metagenome]
MRVSNIHLAALGQGIRGADGQLPRVAVGSVAVILVHVRGQQGRRAQRHGHADDGVAAVRGLGRRLRRAIRVFPEEHGAAVARVAAITGKRRGHAEVVVTGQNRVVHIGLARFAGTALARQAQGQGAVDIAEGQAQRALVGRHTRVFAKAVHDRGRHAAHFRRGVAHGIVDARGRITGQVGCRAGKAAFERVGHVGQGLALQVVLAPHGQHAQRAVDADKCLAAEQLPRLVGAARVALHARFQGEHGLQAISQGLGAAQAQA